MSTASPISSYLSSDGAPELVVDAPRSVTLDYQLDRGTLAPGFHRTASTGLMVLLLAAGGFGGSALLHRIDLQEVNSTSPHRSVTARELLGLSSEAPLADSLAKLLNAGNGWADGEGIAPQLPALAWARDFGDAVGHALATSLVVSPTLEGGVVIERQIGPSRWSLDVDPDGDPLLIVVSHGTTKTAEPVSPGAAAETFRAFLTKSVAVLA